MDLPTYNLEAIEEQMSVHPLYSQVTDFVHPTLFTWCSLNDLPQSITVPYSTLSLN